MAAAGSRRAAKPAPAPGPLLSWPADKVERWPLDRLLPYARNARTHSDAQVAQIAASIREWGWTIPVLVNESGDLIAGHGRILAARQLGIDAVPAMVARGWSEAKIRAYRIADNRLGELSSWDDEILGLEFADLQQLGAPVDLIGFDAQSVQELIAAANVESLTRLPDLPNGERSPFQQMAFILHDSQVETVKAALAAAKAAGPFDGLNENSNGNALARIAEVYVA